MAQVITWWLLVELLSFLALPFALLLFRNLPDRGYFFAKPLGILLLSYLVWITGSARLPSNSLAGIVLILLLLSFISILMWRRRRDQIRKLFQEQRSLIILTEVLFLGFFIGWALLRSHNPAISHTEQPMDLAFLNSTLRASHFPPLDPWLSGFGINYYYFGYLMMSILTKLSGVAAAIGYNLALSLVIAMATGAVISIVYNLVRGMGGSFKTALGFGLLGALFLTLLGNLEGVLELMYAHGVGSADFWNFIGLERFSTPYHSPQWYPTEFSWWWWATRVVGGNAITEFPFFSFAPIGDLHPHFMALPFALMAIALSFNILRTPDRLGLSWIKGNVLQFGLTALALGGLWFLNSWDFPTYVILFLTAVVAQVFLQRQGVKNTIVAVISFATALIAVAVLLYLPFYLQYESPILGVSLFYGIGAFPLHYIILWGLFLFMAISLALAQVIRGWKQQTVSHAQVYWAILPIVFLLVIWVLATLAMPGSSHPLWERGASVAQRLWLLIPLSAVLAFVLFVLLRAPRDSKQLSVFFALILTFLGILLTVVVELVYIRDELGGRTNTVFKLSYQAWTLLAVASAVALYYIITGWQARSRLLRPAKGAWWLVFLALVAGAAIYPAAFIQYQVGSPNTGPTLNGLAYTKMSDPAEYAAIDQLNREAKGSPVIVEAVGNDYSGYARVSARTGLPTILGWPGHEIQWRGYDYPGVERERDVALIYQSKDDAQTKALLQKYSVTYVYVGRLEKEKYGTEGVAKFADFMDTFFRNDEVVIFKVRN